MDPITSGIAGLLVGIALGLFFDRLRMGSAYKTGDDIIAQARLEAENVRKEEALKGKEDLIARREEMEKEVNAYRDEVREQERRLDKRETLLEDQHSDLRKKEQMLETNQAKLSERLKSVDSKEKELDRVMREEQDLLHKISGLDREAAKEMLLKRIDRTLGDEIGGLILKHETELKEQTEKISREMIGMAIQRYASEHTSETTVSTIDIPSDDMKGRIIGREGRNIRAFEKATGVDVIVDDTPGVVIVSAFDNVRRETAKLTLQKLIQDGRIHPSRIEEVHAETEKEMEEHIRKLGVEACEEAETRGLHKKIVELMGRLQFRVSYSQNVRQHSIEVAHLTGLLAEQLNLDVDLARRCGFLHDIGKAADHEMEGGHPAVGAELLKRYGECEEV
ncbi:MAG: DUF3552 domain-containing protein, partial [Planctomycetaceae bacterium]|nr:DUF3552 domain-containing protein [Planctomycetaceae bacterium]